MNSLRRQLLIALSLLPAASALGALSGDSAIRRLLQLYDNPAAAIRMGGVYLELYPSSLTDTLKRISQRLGLDDSLLVGIADRPLRNLVSETIRQDFEFGRTATIRGWSLSQMELDICALHCLVPRQV